MDDKDFDLYLNGSDLPGATDSYDAGGTDLGTADAQTAASALDTMGDGQTEGEATAAPVEEPVQEATPSEQTTEPATAEAPVAGEGENEGEASLDNLMKMLDSLNTTSDESADANAEIKTAAEEIKQAAPESDTVLQTKIDDLIAKLADKEANEIKMQKTIDILKSEYEKTLNDKISLEFGTASDSRIAQIVNEDPDVKALIAAKMGQGDDAQSKVMEAWKSGRENVSGSKISDLVSEKKDSEVDALASSGEDYSDIFGGTEDGLYL